MDPTLAPGKTRPEVILDQAIDSRGAQGTPPVLVDAFERPDGFCAASSVNNTIGLPPLGRPWTAVNCFAWIFPLSNSAYSRDAYFIATLSSCKK